KRMRNKLKTDDRTYQIFGWILFIICAILYAIASFKSRDAIAFLASIVFLVACIVFLIPLLRPDHK
ncbi:MAG: hypothetical protein VKL39_11250, partial [Leptolyngbyaceae bacterium]|nr:hypothetical protein [Leptolyngbyaceae bacterium]